MAASFSTAALTATANLAAVRNRIVHRNQPGVRLLEGRQSLGKLSQRRQYLQLLVQPLDFLIQLVLVALGVGDFERVPSLHFHEFVGIGGGGKK